MIQRILAIAILLASPAYAGAETFAESLDDLERRWVFTCVKHASDEPKCPQAVEYAMDHIRKGFADAHRHEALEMSARHSLVSCGENLKSYAPEATSASEIVIKVAACAVHVHETMIEKKGGLLKYLIWYESLDDPEV